MKNRKILYVSSEVVPYLPESEISSMSFEIPKMVNKQGGQIRIFMPRYGNINERRHQLHEVIRLSGLNLVINDLDMPLIIKVASIPKERIQVYFIDNEEYFKRKATLRNSDGKLVIIDGGVEQDFTSFITSLKSPGSNYDHHFNPSNKSGMGAKPSPVGNVSGGSDNPWKTGNLTRQLIMENEDPDLAAVLKREAQKK